MIRHCAKKLTAARALFIAFFLTAIVASKGLAADITDVDSKGLQAMIDAAHGHTVIVNFWATWCGPCRTEFPELIRLRDDMPESELTVLGVSVDFDKDMLRAFLSENKFNYPNYFADSRLMNELSIDAIPKTWIIAPDGALVQNHDGPATYEELRAAIRSAQRGVRAKQQGAK